MSLRTVFTSNGESCMLDFSSLDNETRNAEDTISMESRIGENKTVKRGKGRPPKNASAFDALDIVTEQTLRVSTIQYSKLSSLAFKSANLINIRVV